MRDGLVSNNFRYKRVIYQRYGKLNPNIKIFVFGVPEKGGKVVQNSVLFPVGMDFKSAPKLLNTPFSNGQSAGWAL